MPKSDDFANAMREYGMRKRTARWFKTGTGIFARAVWHLGYNAGYNDALEQKFTQTQRFIVMENPDAK